MPLLNIYSVISNNIILQIAFAFLSSKKEEDYTWAIETSFLKLYKKYNILALKYIIIDKELALLNTLNNFFFILDYILCYQHVNMNVIAKTKKHFKTNKEF